MTWLQLRFTEVHFECCVDRLVGERLSIRRRQQGGAQTNSVDGVRWAALWDTSEAVEQGLQAWRLGPCRKETRRSPLLQMQDTGRHGPGHPDIVPWTGSLVSPGCFLESLLRIVLPSMCVSRMWQKAWLWLLGDHSPALPLQTKTNRGDPPTLSTAREQQKLHRVVVEMPGF